MLCGQIDDGRLCNGFVGLMRGQQRLSGSNLKIKCIAKSPQGYYCLVISPGPTIIRITSPFLLRSCLTEINYSLTLLVACFLAVDRGEML